MSTLWIENVVNLRIEVHGKISAFSSTDLGDDLFDLPGFKHILFPDKAVEVIHTAFLGEVPELDEKISAVYNVVYGFKTLEFVNPNASNTNKTRIDKFPPTTRSELENYKRRLIDEKKGNKLFNGRFWEHTYTYKQRAFQIAITINNDEFRASPALEARLYSNEEIAEANVLAQRQQERQEANKVVAKSPLAGTGVSGIVTSFLGGRRHKRQSRRKRTRKQSRRK